MARLLLRVFSSDAFTKVRTSRIGNPGFSIGYGTEHALRLSEIVTMGKCGPLNRRSPYIRLVGPGVFHKKYTIILQLVDMLFPSPVTFATECHTQAPPFPYTGFSCYSYFEPVDSLVLGAGFRYVFNPYRPLYVSHTFLRVLIRRG